jgi:hypothetical protein
VRRGNDLAAAGFLVFVVGETLILSGAAMTLEASAPAFAAGVSLWAAALVLVSASAIMPTVIRSVGSSRRSCSRSWPCGCLRARP